MQGDLFLWVTNVLPDYYEACPLLDNNSPVGRYEYRYVKGVDLKAWITDEGVRKVFDVLMIANGFVRTTPFAFNPQFTKGDIILKCEGEWFLNGVHCSWLSDVQDEYRKLTGEELKAGHPIF